MSIVGIFLGIYTLGVSYLPPQWAALSVVAVLFPFIAMIVGNVRRLLLGVILLDIPFQLDIHPGFRTEISQLGALSGWSISATTLSLVVLYVLWLSELLTGVAPRSRSLLRASLPPTLYLAFAALSMVVARDVTLSLFEIFLLLQMLLLYVYIAGTVRTRQDVLFIVTMLLIGLILEGLVMIVLQYTGGEFHFAGIGSRVDVQQSAGGQFYRIGGTLGSPVTAASYFAMLLAPAISILLTHLGRSYKWLGVLAFGLGGAALVLTFTRGGWVAFALSIAILCLLAWRRGWLPPAVPIFISILAVLLLLPFRDAVLTRLGDVVNVQARIILMKLGVRAIMDHPVLGVGANNFPIIMQQYVTPEFSGAFLYAIHNKYLLVWAETGIGGLVTFIWFLLATIRKGWQVWTSGDRFLSPLALGFTAAIAGQMAHMLFDIFHSRPQVQLLWLVAGLITAMHYLDSEKQE